MDIIDKIFHLESDETLTRERWQQSVFHLWNPALSKKSLQRVALDQDFSYQPPDPPSNQSHFCAIKHKAQTIHLSREGTV